MSTDFGHRQFYYHSPCLGTVVAIYPLTAQDRRLYVDVLPLDNRGPIIKAPVMTMPGAARQLRNKMTVLVFFIDGNPQSPVVMGHNHNNEAIKSLFGDPMHPAHVNLDDHVVAHEESGAYFRIRSRTSTALQGAPDLSPVVYDVIFNSGAKLQVYEYDPTGYTPPPPTAENPPPPPAPDRVNASFTTPSGLVIVLDEPVKGQVTTAIQHPAGATVVIAADGTMQVTSPTGITHVAPTVTTQAPPTVPPAASVAVAPPATAQAGTSPVPTLPPALQAFEAEVQHIVDAATKKISALTAQAQTIIDGIEGSISHAAAKIGLGASGSTVASLDDDLDSALTKSHLNDFENSLHAQRLQDLLQLVSAMVTVSVPQSPEILASTIGSLVHIPVPSGSPIAKIQSS